MPRFVFLYHHCPPGCARPSHWDLMLEVGGVLRTWAVTQLPRDWLSAYEVTLKRFPECPNLAIGNGIDAEQLTDHRREYLEFEGELSGHRGQVIRVAAGTYTDESESPTCWQLSLNGDTVSGRIELRRLHSESVSWKLTHTS